MIYLIIYLVVFLILLVVGVSTGTVMELVPLLERRRPIGVETREVIYIFRDVFSDIIWLCLFWILTMCYYLFPYLLCKFIYIPIANKLARK
jgi:hypothetical protein